MIRRSICTFLVTTTLAGTALAQTGTPSVLRINDDVHFGLLLVETESSSQLIEAERGRLTLRNDLSFSLASTIQTVTAGLMTSTGPNSDSGVYVITPDGRLALDFLPAFPGTDTFDLWINDSATMALQVRSEAESESFIVIALRASSGLTAARANGRYTLVSKFMEYTPAGLTSGVATGTGTFDGSGGWSFSGQEQSISAAGVASVGPVGGAGTYTVMPDGTFSISPEEVGGISPDGDVWFTVLMDPSGTEVGITVGVRVGSSYSVGMLGGDWRLADHEVIHGLGGNRPEVYTDLGTVSVNGTTGAFNATSQSVTSNPQSISTQTANLTGTATITPAGVVTFTESGGGTITNTLAQSGYAMVGTDFSGSSVLQLGLRICGGSTAYGSGTPGTGGIAPSAGMSGFPTLGNSSFAMQVVDGLGGAPAALMLAAAPSAGIPFFGGTIWVDPLTIAVVPPLLMSGPAGVPGAGSAQLPLRIPPAAALAGGSLFFQVIVVDQGAPFGLAMSDGFQIGICR